MERQTFYQSNTEEQMQLANQLQQYRKRLEFAEKIAHLGYWELDIESRRFYWSEEMYRILGYEQAADAGSRSLFREQIFPEDLPVYKHKLIELIKKQHDVSGQIRIKRLDNKLIYCQFRAGVINDWRGARIAGTLQDITEHIEIQNLLEAERRKAEELSLSKSYFLAQASHDLRQPLQALNLFVAALAEEHLSQKASEIVNKIKASSENLKFLLDNLLDISKLEAGGLSYAAENFNLQNLLQRLVEEYCIIANKRGIRLNLRCPSLFIHSDALLIERIVRNLISNALKYARSRVLISCHANSAFIYIAVIDNGIGISKKEMSKIFDEFYQGQDIPQNRRLGAGLGLSIVRKITKLLGGEIKVKSVLHRYSCFSLRFPR